MLEEDSDAKIDRLAAEIRAAKKPGEPIAEDDPDTVSTAAGWARWSSANAKLRASGKRPSPFAHSKLWVFSWFELAGDGTGSGAAIVTEGDNAYDARAAAIKRLGRTDVTIHRLPDADSKERRTLPEVFSLEDVGSEWPPRRRLQVRREGNRVLSRMIGVDGIAEPWDYV